jgi:hypothetical protein
MVVTHQQWPWPEDSIDLFGRDTQANRYGAQVFIEVYPLPEGTKQFQEGLALYRNQRKGFLVEGSKFDPSFLLPRSFPADFERKSFQTRDGVHRRRIVHLFKAPPGIGNRLHFTLQLDQSQLGASIHELEKVTAEFPVRAV